MKRNSLWKGAFLCAFALCGAANAEEVTTDVVEKEVVSFAGLDQERWAYMREHMQDIVVEVPEGTFLPLTLLLRGNFLAYTPDEVSSQEGLQVLRTFYVQHQDDALVFSTNKSNWQTFTEFFTGNLVLEMSEEVANLVLHGELLDRASHVSSEDSE